MEWNHRGGGKLSSSIYFFLPIYNMLIKQQIKHFSVPAMGILTGQWADSALSLDSWECWRKETRFSKLAFAVDS